MKFLHMIVMLGVSGVCSAAPLTWTLTNVIYDDGGIVTGSFDYDAETDIYSNVSIQSPEYWEGDWWWAEQNLTEDGQWGGPAAMESRWMDPACFNCENDPVTVITLKYATALTSAGGTVSLIPNVSFFSNGVSDPQSPFYGFPDGFPDWSSNMDRKIVSGTLSAVPVPAAVWLFGSALAGLGWMRRKQTV
jgi:hypothetical protein